MAKQGTIVIDAEACKGCEVCVGACPLHLIELGKQLNKKGYLYAVQAKEGCTGCASCGIMCPEGAITVYREK
ncbi:MAG: ferredoxin family protein [Bacteroidetes bacterium]|jgi:2-oxoglutarate ferredoxin oxidoreductase subunit delta|nr:ferredoxin family protein [Bacteroidota bacterium]